MQYQKICLDAMEVVKLTAAYIKTWHENRDKMDIQAKGRHNFVTEVDKKAEEILVEGLSKLLPESGFIAEEGTSNHRGEVYNWIIDPIDGTTNFIHGLFPFSISVGLTEGDDVVAGIVYVFGMDEYFYAWKGGGAWLNGKSIHVSKVNKVENALIATGFPYTNYTYMNEFMDSVDYFMKNSHGLRRLGSAAADIAYVACGRFEAFYEYGLNPWDIAAGILLVTEAGGLVSDFNGEDNPLFGQDVICSNSGCFTEFQLTIQKIMKPA